VISQNKVCGILEILNDIAKQIFLLNVSTETHDLDTDSLT